MPHARILASLLTLALAACDTVTSPAPLGEEVVRVNPAEWEGFWMHPDGPLSIKVIDAEQGLLRFDYEDEGKPVSLPVQLRQSNGWQFVNVTVGDFDPDLDAEHPEHWLWARVLHKGDTLIAWGPQPSVFAGLVAEGVLPGAVDEGSVVLGSLCPEHYRVITASSHGLVLDWENPLVLTRAAHDGLPPPLLPGADE